ncbi:hypothetical protein G4H71_08380 [Rhodococcus triatomae]|uniref:DUF7144 domain-containing protein n=1 Tax=Rhodococcus triatomae TaxID=300028 RepID=A0A1G8IEZ5_9NOCA|nr:hypothetical protein [Rhodococcus triatomae]QNG21037.1 hypothetical protein G4H72_22005 [Rhodococcus triatomae]QNG23048.1 hypothetical protein G4H71_08380 [Rhodococcus triatomae]SDI17412.1 hypothetical protein SAMN05444695_105257 [Rhodococcus triatomae]
MSNASQGGTVKQGFAAGASIGAAILLLVVGVLSFFQGIAAVAKDDVFVVGIEYVYKLNVTTWGWIHIVLGVVLVVSAIGLAIGATWARVVAIVLASLSIIANFLWLPYYPLWAILIIALDIVVIWAVTTWDTDR